MARSRRPAARRGIGRRQAGASALAIACAAPAAERLMLAGHFGVALGLKARYPSVPLLTILIASQLPDWMFVLFYVAGWETLNENAAHLFHPTTFGVIPFSHDLAMLAMYAGLGAAIGLLLWSSRWALAVGWAIVAHGVLDVVVHAPDMGVGGPWLPIRVGLDLWERAPYVAWFLELAVIVCGGVLYARRHRHSSRAWALPGVLLVVQVAALLVW